MLWSRLFKSVRYKCLKLQKVLLKCSSKKMLVSLIYLCSIAAVTPVEDKYLATEKDLLK